MSYDLDAIRARLAAATPGPADVEDDDMGTPGGRTVFRVVPDAARERRRQQGSSARPNYIATVYGYADAAFFANAPRDIANLLNQIDEQREDREAVCYAKEEIERLRLVIDVQAAALEAADVALRVAVFHDDAWKLGKAYREARARCAR